MSDATTTPDNTDEPLWLDEAYISKILNKYTNNQLKEIKTFRKAPATAKGEHFASAMHLLSIEYSLQTKPEVTQNITFIVKSRLENEFMSQIEEDFNIFHREAQVYTVIMDEAEKLLRSLGDDTKFGPKAIFVDERVIVQENLKVQGYTIGDIKVGFSYEQCRMILEKLAKFHAVSMVLYKKNPDMFRHHLPGNVSEHSSPMHDMYTNSIRATIEYCKTNTQLQQYVERLEAFGEKIIPKMINVFSRNQADRFHVLNHGDVWVNNIMFHKNSVSQMDNVLFVDYQEGFYGSPGIDWNFFIFSSWQKEVFASHYEDLVISYHSTLTTILLNLNYTQRIPTLEDVKKEIINKGYHGLATATCMMPILISEYSDLASPENFLLDTDEAIKNRQKIFDNPKYGERLVLFLKFFEDNGIL